MKSIVEQKNLLQFILILLLRLIGVEDSLGRSFQEIFNRTDNWISEGSGGVIESIDAEYVYVSIYSPLSGSSYTELLDGLRTQKRVRSMLKMMTSNAFFGAISGI